MDKKQIKKKLKTSCRGVLEDLLEDVGFSNEERIIFYNRYVLADPHSVPYICLMVPCSPSKYNDLHNSILDKVLSHFLRIN